MKKEQIYFIGLLKDGNKVTVQMTKSIDSLSCEVWIYYGQFINTKKKVRENRAQLLQAINERHNTTFTKIAVI